jgi:hypothetical protein
LSEHTITGIPLNKQAFSNQPLQKGTAAKSRRFGFEKEADALELIREKSQGEHRRQPKAEK